MLNNSAVIFNIQRFSVHDGPGIRTTVFLKGCPLRCKWCHNPESINPFLEIVYDQAKCVHCFKCNETCPEDALAQHSNGIHLERKRCINCGKCANICYSRALELIGSFMTVEEVMTEIQKDMPFYKNSGGGLTASGGEPLMQATFVADLFREAQEKSIHTTLDTTGYAKWAVLCQVLKHTDLILYDFKALDAGRHQKLTGVSNDLILKNLERLSRENRRIIVRIPIIPGYTFIDPENDAQNIAEYLQGLESINRVDLLPFHHLAKQKYINLGREEAITFDPPSSEYLGRIINVLASHQITVSIGGLL
ncbi:MAG: glycyl-radical enzyme activating protein [Candidatus Hodarchaeota archaeon]